MIMTTVAPQNQLDNQEHSLQRSDIFEDETLEPRNLGEDSKFLKIGSL